LAWRRKGGAFWVSDVGGGWENVALASPVSINSGLRVCGGNLAGHPRGLLDPARIVLAPITVESDHRRLLAPAIPHRLAFGKPRCRGSTHEESTTGC